MQNSFEIKRLSGNNVFFRNPNYTKTKKTQPEELEKMVLFLTNEEFEDFDGIKYKRRLVNPQNFEIVNKYPTDFIYEKEDKDEKYICLCSEDSCEHLVIVRHKPTNIYFAVGSVCYLRFNELNATEIYYKCKAKQCNDCRNPLVFKTCKFPKNTDKKCEGRCFGCVEKKKEEARKEKEEEERVYLRVRYEDKDDAKSMGARWNPEKKKWYAPNNSAKYTELIKKYK